jgi:hypothetical protein
MIGADFFHVFFAQDSPHGGVVQIAQRRDSLLRWEGQGSPPSRSCANLRGPSLRMQRLRPRVLSRSSLDPAQNSKTRCAPSYPRFVRVGWESTVSRQKAGSTGKQVRDLRIDLPLQRSEEILIGAKTVAEGDVQTEHPWIPRWSSPREVGSLVPPQVYAHFRNGYCPAEIQPAPPPAPGWQQIVLLYCCLA